MWERCLDSKDFRALAAIPAAVLNEGKQVLARIERELRVWSKRTNPIASFLRRTMLFDIGENELVRSSKRKWIRWHRRPASRHPLHPYAFTGCHLFEKLLNLDWFLILWLAACAFVFFALVAHLRDLCT